MTNFILLLTGSDSVFHGGAVCTVNPDGTTGIWYYNQGIAKPPFPFADQAGTLEPVAGSSLLLFGPPSHPVLNASVWNLNLSTVKDQDTGSISTPNSMYQWQYFNLPNATHPRLVEHFPVGIDTAELHQSKAHRV